MAATPSLSHRALTIKSSLFHQNGGVVVVDVDVPSSEKEAPSGVKSRGAVKAKSRGKVGFGNRAANTGGALPRVPLKMAVGTLSG